MPPDAARDAVITVQARVIEMLAAETARLAGQVTDLAARVERLERLASRNSENSSMPPSADNLPGRTPPRGRPGQQKKGERKPGKQPGSPGSHLAWSEDPDERKPHYPQGSCACGADLADARDLGIAASHQQIDIPLMTAKVTQHDLHAVECGCGRVHTAPAPAHTRRPEPINLAEYPIRRKQVLGGLTHEYYVAA
jgi:transposase